MTTATVAIGKHEFTAFWSRIGDSKHVAVSEWPMTAQQMNDAALSRAKENGLDVQTLTRADAIWCMFQDARANGMFAAPHDSTLTASERKDMRDAG